MGYDTTISIYNAQGKYIGDVIYDITFRAFRNLIDFSYKNQVSDEDKNSHYIFGDLICHKDILKGFKGTDFENEIANAILTDTEVAYFSITSV